MTHQTVTTVPLVVRSSWIQKLYPQVEVIEAWNGPQEVGYTPAIMLAQEQYVIDLLGDREVSHFYCSEQYGEHMSRALNAIDRRVDEERINYPVSGTEIRTGYSRHKDFLAPCVLESLMEYTEKK